MTKKREGRQVVTEVDCALLMMLDEERDKFIKHNHHLVIEKPKSSGFVPFTFFDRQGKLRKGIIYSCGKKMGNTEACKLYYKFSRQYKAHLYINLGVSGYFNDINIGDVLFVDRLSTLSEDNATNSELQITDGPFSAVFPTFSQAFLESFKKTSCKRLENFHKKLKDKKETTDLELDETRLTDLLKTKFNIIKAGRCLTVPEVIKGDVGKSRFPDIRKGSVVDMEAYYLFDWYRLINKQEPHRMVAKSSFLVFKSVSDMADDNKAIVEECGSRDLAMANLCDVVCAYLTDVHTFYRETEETISTYFQTEIRQRSLDPLFTINSTAEQKEAFGNLCRFFMTTDSKEDIILGKDCITIACEFLSVPQRTLLLNGHSGTGKSTFISYVFDTISRDRVAILVDFSKFNSTTAPTDEQIVYLLGRLLACEKSITVFLDGVDIGCNTYDELLSAIRGGTYTNLSLCIGDVTDTQINSTRNPSDLVPPNTIVASYSFGGLSIYSPQLESVIKTATLYFASINKKPFDEKEILTYIQTSGLSHIDFRLLKMFADYENQRSREGTFYKFMDWYCVEKVTRSVISNLYQYIPFTLGQNKDLSEEQRNAYQILSQNSYMRAFLFANCIAEIVEKNDRKTMEDLLRSDYLLSNDMNLFLESRLNDKLSGNSFTENLLPYLLEPTDSINLSAQTQLIYNVFQVTELRSYKLKKQRRELLCNQILKAKKHCEESRINGEDYYDWSIQYRTLSILIWRSLDKNERKREFLDEYNQLLLTDRDTRQYNLAFHLYYYSQREFTFEQVNMFETQIVTDEMVFNTYYTLIHYLCPENLKAWKDNQDPFVCMNIITFAHLIQDVLIGFERFSYLASSVCQALEDRISSLQCWKLSQISIVTHGQLIELLEDTLKELKAVE